MKKLLLLFAAMLVAVAASHAQTPTATLSHEGTVKCFYGKEAFVNAVAQSADGDKITLSSGLFTSTTINKAITVRGAGMSADTINGIEPTVISSDFSIQKENVILEGLYMSGDLTLYHYNNIKIINCTIEGTIKNNNSTKKGVVNKYFMGCKTLDDGYGLTAYCDSINLYINNCYIKRLANSSTTTYHANHIEIMNSIIGLASGGSASSSSCSITNSSLINCIIIPKTATMVLPSSNYAYYNVGIGASALFENISAAYGTQVGITNKVVSNYSDIFKTFTGSNQSEFEDYSLTSAAASTYLGDDGTQVGIYGGSMPFNPRVNNPYITKCTVAEKSTPQGTLSVDIEVKPAQ